MRRADGEKDVVTMHADDGASAYFYMDHAKTCAPDDFWGQVKRTVNGKAVGEDQIQMIVDAVISGLKIEEDDTLLDLCCGNGALTDRIFAHCAGGLGVDFCPELIEVAKRYFQSEPGRMYELSDVESFVRTTDVADHFSKVVCYGAFQYLSRPKAESVLTHLQRRFPKVQRIFIGNLPDKEKIDVFFADRARAPAIEDDPGSPIGIWRSEDEFAELAAKSGWAARFERMPPAYYAAAYRYDAILTRNEY